MNYRRLIIRLFTFLGGIYFFLEFVLPGTIGGVQIDKYHDQISKGFIVVGAMAVGLGLINLLMVHGSKIIFRRKGAPNSLALLFGLFIMMYVTGSVWVADESRVSESRTLNLLASFSEVIPKDHEEKKASALPFYQRNQALKDAASKALSDVETELDNFSLEVIPKSSTDYTFAGSLKEDLAKAVSEAQASVAGLVVLEDQSSIDFSVNESLKQNLRNVAYLKRELASALYKYSTTKRLYSILFDGLFVALGSAMFSLLGFYIAAAAYRAFRIRSAESTLMLVAAFLVMLGQIPFSIWVWDGFTDIRLWLLSVPNTAAFRAIKIGASVAGLIMALRMWLSIESESFKSDG